MSDADMFELGGSRASSVESAADAVEAAEHMARFLAAMQPDPREWEWSGEVFDAGSPRGGGGEKCVCGHPIRFVFPVVRGRDNASIKVGSVCIDRTIPFVIAMGADNLAESLQRALDMQKAAVREAERAKRAAAGDAIVEELAGDWAKLQAWSTALAAGYEARKPYWSTQPLPEWFYRSFLRVIPKRKPKAMSTPGRTAKRMRDDMAPLYHEALMSLDGETAPVPVEPQLRASVVDRIRRDHARDVAALASIASSGSRADTYPLRASVRRAESALERLGAL